MESKDARWQKELVARGYDLLKGAYYQWTSSNDPRYRLDQLGWLMDRLARGAKVLELGCGPGLPVALTVSKEHYYVGVDLSVEQLRLAVSNAPAGHYVRADMAEVEFRPGSFDAVAAFYSVIHVPRSEHQDLFRGIANWLRPGGVFVASLGARDNPGGVEEWIDSVEMFWSSHDADTNLEMIEEAGLAIEGSEVLKNFEDDQEVYFLWVIASRNPSSG